MITRFTESHPQDVFRHAHQQQQVLEKVMAPDSIQNLLEASHREHINSGGARLSNGKRNTALTLTDVAVFLCRKRVQIYGKRKLE